MKIYNDNILEGTFIDGLINGFGRCTIIPAIDINSCLDNVFSTATGYIEGNLVDDKFNGLATSMTNDGRIYVGQHKKNKWYGQGAYYFPDGAYYKGNFNHWLRSGYGEMTWADGSKWAGQWENDRPKYTKPWDGFFTLNDSEADEYIKMGK